MKKVLFIMLALAMVGIGCSSSSGGGGGSSICNSVPAEPNGGDPTGRWQTVAVCPNEFTTEIVDVDCIITLKMTFDMSMTVDLREDSIFTMTNGQNEFVREFRIPLTEDCFYEKEEGTYEIWCQEEGGVVDGEYCVRTDEGSEELDPEAGFWHVDGTDIITASASMSYKIPIDTLTEESLPFAMVGDRLYVWPDMSEEDNKPPTIEMPEIVLIFEQVEEERYCDEIEDVPEGGEIVGEWTAIDVCPRIHTQDGPVKSCEVFDVEENVIFNMNIEFGDDYTYGISDQEQFDFEYTKVSIGEEGCYETAEDCEAEMGYVVGDWCIVYAYSGYWLGETETGTWEIGESDEDLILYPDMIIKEGESMYMKYNIVGNHLHAYKPMYAKGWEEDYYSVIVFDSVE